MPESLQTESEKSTGQAMSQLRSSSIDLIARSIASVLAAIYGLGFVIFVVVGKIFLERPLLAVFLSILAFLFILGGFLAPPLSKPTGYLTAMFCCIALYVTIVKRARSSLRFAFDYRSWYLAAAVLWIYITQIFGNLRPKWGGGKPTPILIFQHSPAPWSPSNPTDAL